MMYSPPRQSAPTPGCHAAAISTDWRLVHSAEGGGHGGSPPEPTDALSIRGEEGRLRILVIDDNRDYAEGLQTLFELLGHAASIAYDGNAGVEVAMREPPDLVVCDIGLPGLNGYQVAQALRQNPRMRATYLVAVTGYSSEADRASAFQAGFDAHIGKPAEAEQILALVASARQGDDGTNPAPS